MQLLKNTLLSVGWMISFLRPIYVRWKSVFMIIYSGYRGRTFKHFGKTSRIHPFFNTLVGEDCISIGEQCYIGKDVQLTATKQFEDQTFDPIISVGDNCSIGDYSHITAINEIRLGNNVRMGKNILITDNSHGASVREMLDTAPNYRPLVSKGPVIIDDNVWIGTKSCIMPNVKIGRCAIIGAGSVVTKDIPPYAVATGVPAKVVKIMDK